MSVELLTEETSSQVPISSSSSSATPQYLNMIETFPFSLHDSTYSLNFLPLRLVLKVQVKVLKVQVKGLDSTSNDTCYNFSGKFIEKSKLGQAT